MARKAKRQLLSNEARDAIRATREDLAIQLADMDRAESCGVDCQAYRALAQYVDAKLALIERVIFTGEAPSREMIEQGRSEIMPPMPMG